MILMFPLILKFGLLCFDFSSCEKFQFSLLILDGFSLNDHTHSLIHDVPVL